MRSTFEGEAASKKEAHRTLWNHVVNAGDESPDRREEDAGRVWYTSVGKLVKKRLENDVERVWATEPPVATNARLASPTAQLEPAVNGRYSRSLFSTGGKLLRTGKDAKMQTGQNEFSVWGGDPPGSAFLVSGEVGACL